jgi:hypothetical protein
MGHELYRMIRDGAPPGWTVPMRLVAAMIADDARDPGQSTAKDGGRPWSAIPVRGSWADGEWRDGLTERTGMSEHTVRRALAALGRAGYEMREQVAADSRGRPVFACKGHTLNFRVPPLKPRQSPPDMADLTAQSPPDMADLTASKASQIGRKGEPNLSQSPADLAGPISPVPPDHPRSPTGAAETTAQTILAGFIDWDHANGGHLTRRTIGQLAKHIGGLLAEGVGDKHIRQGLADWRGQGQHPSTLHSFVDAAMRGSAAARSRRQAERDGLSEREMARALARDAARERRGGQS